MSTIALLVTALLFGGMTLFAFGFAAVLFAALPPDPARQAIRRSFPFFYLFVIAVSAIGALAALARDPLAAVLLAAIAVTTVPTRQILMPAINRATDRADRTRFKRLHGLSVVITLAHIGVAGYVVTRFAA